MGFDDLAEARRAEQERRRLKFQSQAGILYQKGNLAVFEREDGAADEGIHGKKTGGKFVSQYIQGWEKRLKMMFVSHKRKTPDESGVPSEKPIS